MSSDAVYSILLYDFAISSANNYKKFGSVELGSVQPVFGITRSGITSGDCIMEINQDIEGISFNKKNQYYIFNIMNVILKEIY